MGNTYVAKEPLFIGRHRAHNEGDVVPENNVERNGWTDKVKKVSEKAAAEGLDFDPSQHSVSDVNAYLAEADEDERDRVLGLEREGQARSTVKGL